MGTGFWSQALRVRVGSELVPELRKRYGRENVVLGVRSRPPQGDLGRGPSEKVDVTKKNVIAGIVKEYDIDIIYHMAAILSVAGEANPWLAWDVNINDTYNILEVTRENNLDWVFVPSAIAIFGPETHIERARPKTLC